MGLFSFFRKKKGGKVYTNSMAVDPVEKTAEYKAVANEVDRLVKAEIGEGGYLGYCHVYWAAKKRILLQRYNISWHSPAELNPHIHFD